MPAADLDRVAHAIAQATPPAPMTSRIVAVDGGGGAGKSTFALKLSDWLGAAPIVHTDDFASPDVPIDWWPRLIAQVLLPLAENRAARYQRYDWTAGRLADWLTVAPAPVIILDGVTASRVEFLPYLSYSIWIDTPRSERLRRGLARDGVQAYEQWQGWLAAEDRYRADQQPGQRADLIVDGTEGIEMLS